ncbi:MAG TPA: Rne/Rng family ribonuclease [Phycisphaerales bacterium]|nr:Rne/Rng family ribonuclease [Phycisphaerales bacterium]
MSPSSNSDSTPHAQMLINYVPGEECRVAIVEDGKLEELHVEKFASASRVGNIYVGKVVNVEPAIQAAFVDFGCGENGFLHVTDLHPRYFPGEDDDTTERVGFKTPRRERPPIQAALRRGDEVIVQVLKEGVGTKGPTVTSYLSIPGRFLVMMPQMDKVGVSRKVEDEDLRRQMREILDQLDLPEGFGFILRTAGLSRTKAELKRDLAYLQRLWKDMDRRLKAGGKPRLLYSESDLLVRSLRDMLSSEIAEVIIDNELALRRASRFMKIVAPRGTTKLLHFPDKTPMFHAFGIERQIALIHAREVPLPSGGRLVIDQTEALVAIDVNSGKSRDSRDAETNAYQTNLEAVDEICRQLRLRDMGGIVINDLIDMRDSRHRKDIEGRFKERLKRDRAKTTVLQISEFGILEMTRQRMRPSHESVHFTDCPTCRGRGMLQRPDSVAADALRDMAAILDWEKVNKCEMVVAPRVASELLSTKRQLLGRTERTYGKHVDVRVSETVPVDRVTFYAYDQQGADIDTTSLPNPKKPRNLVQWEEPAAEDWAVSPEEEAAALPPEPEPEVAEEDLAHPIEFDEADDGAGGLARGGSADSEGGEGEGGRKRRRRRRGGRGRTREDGREEGAPRDQRPQREQRPPARGEQRIGEQRTGEARPAERREGRDQRQGERRDDRQRQPQRGGYQNQGRGAPPVRDEGDLAASQAVDPEWGDAPVVNPNPHVESSPELVDDARDQGTPIPPEGADEGDFEEGGGPQGGPGEGGEGGRRRRRRRRRGGRGRNRENGEFAQQNGHAPAETQGEAGDQDGARDPDEVRAPMNEAEAAAAADFEAEGGRFTPEVGEPAPAPDAREGEGGDEFEDEAGGPPQGSSEQREGENGEGGGRRRRRRRRGRGGRGGGGNGQGGQPQPPQGGQQPAREGRPQGGPPREQRDGRDGRGDGRDNRERRDQRPREDRPRDDRPRDDRPRDDRPRQPQPPREQRPAPAPPPPAAPAPKPRTLYGAIRRKLGASELNRKAKPE